MTGLPFFLPSSICFLAVYFLDDVEYSDPS